MQGNWIGRSEGLRVRFALDRRDHAHEPARSELEVFTTRPDTLFGASFLAIAPDHPLAQPTAAKTRSSPTSSPSRKRIGTAQEVIETAEKQGYDTGLRAVHPFDPNWKLPVYVANFVLMEYGTGAIFGCPAHDQRDLDFARKYEPAASCRWSAAGPDPATLRRSPTTAYVGDGTLINSRFLDGLTHRAAKDEVAKRLEGEMRGNAPVGERQVQLPPARLGRVAPALLGLPDPGDPLRRLRRRAGAGHGSAGDAARRRDLRPAGQSARPSSDLEACRLPACGGSGDARDRHVRHVRRLVLVFRPLLRSLERDRADHARRSSITGCRSISISAASSTRSCTCSIRASSPAR